MRQARVGSGRCTARSGDKTAVSTSSGDGFEYRSTSDGADEADGLGVVAGIWISGDVGRVKSWVGACEPRGIGGTCRPKPLAAEGILVLPGRSWLVWGPREQ